MTNVAANIVVGAPSSIVISAYGVAEGSGVIVGLTEGGFKYSWNREHYWHGADQYIGDVGGTCTKETCELEFVLAENTLANLAYAMGYPTTAPASAILAYFGGNATVTYRTIYVNANSISSGTSKYTFHKCVITGVTEVSMVKGDKTGYKVSAKALQDTSQTANQQTLRIDLSGTDTTPPTVAMTSPVEDGTVAKDAKTTVTLTFTEAGAGMDQGSLIYGSADGGTIMLINVTDTTASALVAGSISYDSGTKVLTFTPTTNWTGSDKINIIVSSGVRDIAGNHLADIFVGHFTVAS